MPEPATTVLSPLAHELINADPNAYAKLVVTGNTPPATRSRLAGVAPQQLLTAPPASPAYAHALLAGLWLWHDGLHECHEIVQKSPEDLIRAAGPSRGVPNDRDREPSQDLGRTLAFWHAIMHRREGDFWNSKYWYARCRHHPALAEIPVHAESAVQVLPGMRPVEKLTRSGWDPEAFVDLVEAVHRDPADPGHAAAVRLQQVEWKVLFDYCVCAAAGGG